MTIMTNIGSSNVVKKKFCRLFNSWIAELKSQLVSHGIRPVPELVAAGVAACTYIGAWKETIAMKIMMIEGRMSFFI
jgi:hypothetical protein